MLSAARTRSDQLVHSQLAAELQRERSGHVAGEIRSGGVDPDSARHEHGQQGRRIRQVRKTVFVVTPNIIAVRPCIPPLLVRRFALA